MRAYHREDSMLPDRVFGILLLLCMTQQLLNAILNCILNVDWFVFTFRHNLMTYIAREAWLNVSLALTGF